MKRLGIRYETLQSLTSLSDLVLLLNRVADTYWGIHPARNEVGECWSDSTHLFSPGTEDAGPWAFGATLPCDLIAHGKGAAEAHYPRYRRFDIPKKSGGVRHIVAPMPRLRQLQRAINLMLREAYQPGSCAMGFVAGRNVADNARCHVGKRFVWNLDLRDFFPSITCSQVVQALQQPPFSLRAPVAEALGQFCCYPMPTRVANPATGKMRTLHRLVLPQGAPTSPILSNIVCQKLDSRLQGLATSYGVAYTRYADDITFSANHNLFSRRSSFVALVRTIIDEEGFAVNEQKVRLQSAAQHQEVTGLTVGSKVNVGRGYLKEIRILLHRWERYGEGAALSILADSYNIAHPGREVPPLESYLQGKLDYMKMVKGCHDTTYCALQHRLDLLLRSR